MPTKEIVKVTGVILNAYAPQERGAKKTKVIDFQIKLDDTGETVKASKFYDFDTGLVGKHVSFDANPNDYQGKKQFVVAYGADIEVLGDATEEVVNEAPTPQAEAPRAAIAKAPVASGDPVEFLNRYRDAVTEVIGGDVAEAKKILGARASADAIARLVQAYQATRATLIIQGQKGGF